jgi:hypothetical protein
VVDSAGDRPALEIAEAANQMALSAVMEYIMEIDSLKGAKATEVIKALALLERSGIQRERLKLDARKKADEAIKKLEQGTPNMESLPPEQMTFIKEVIYGLTN